MLSRADVIVLNEADWGVKRTDYRNVTRELAAALQMNYAFGVEFVEVDPLTLGTETFEGEISADKEEMVQNLAVDRDFNLRKQLVDQLLLALAQLVPARPAVEPVEGQWVAGLVRRHRRAH